MIELRGNWDIDWTTFASAPDHNGISNLESLCSSQVSIGGKTQSMNDLCPIEKDGDQEKYFIQFVPYATDSGEIDSVIQDCDLLAYISGPVAIPALGNLTDLTPDHLIPVMKQRCFHAEAGYHGDDGRAYQASVWGGDDSRRLFSEGNTSKYLIHIFRLSFPRLPDPQQARLKAEIKRWAQIFNHHTFPPSTEAMNTDPVDYSSVQELGEIASALINRSPDTNPAIGMVNCVQWTCETIALSLNYPLNRQNLDQLGVRQQYEQYWALRVGYADDGLVGVNALPCRQYSPSRALELALEMYYPTLSLPELLKGFSAAALQSMFSAFIPADHTDALNQYIAEIQAGELDATLPMSNGKPYRVVMPSTFLLEQRRQARGDIGDVPKIDYVATAVPAEFLRKR